MAWRVAGGRATAGAAGAVLAVVAVVVVVASGDRSAPAPAPAAKPPVARVTVTPSPTPTAVPAPQFTILKVRPKLLRVHAAPRGRESMRLTNPNRYGKPLVLLAVESVPGWWLADLPVRPNGSRGWVRAVDVTAARTTYQVHVYLTAHRLDVIDGDRLAMRVPIAVGTADSPTPGGHYYLTMLFKVGDPTGPYGPWAFGISGFSTVYTTFASGNGEIGIHGSNEPWLIPGDVSHGCIRLRNADITRLARMVPVGAPVVIHR